MQNEWVDETRMKDNGNLFLTFVYEFLKGKKFRNNL